MKRISALLCLLALPLSTADASVMYKASIIKPAAGYSLSIAQDINDSGFIAGYSYNTAHGWASNACVWKPDGTLVDLGSGIASAINNAGTVVGRQSDDWSQGPGHPCRWDQSGARTDLTPPNASGGFAYDINELGQVVGSCAVATGPDYACMWNSAGEVTKLGAVPGFTDAQATAINLSGQIAGILNDNGTGHAYLWDPKAGYQMIDALGGGESVAWGLNDNGQVVGRATDPSGVTHPFIWDAVHGMRNLWLFPGYDVSGEAYDINNQGYAVGWGWKDGYTRAMAWTPDGNVIGLGLPDNCYSSKAFGINNKGQIVGEVSDISGANYAVVWTPVPEPSSVLALLSGLLAMPAFMRRRNK